MIEVLLYGAAFIVAAATVVVCMACAIGSFRDRELTGWIYPILFVGVGLWGTVLAARYMTTLIEKWELIQ